MNNPSPPSPPPYAVIYGRLSKGDAALESHEARNRQYVEFQRFTLLSTFEDEDTSGGIPLADRTGGRAMLNRLQRGDIRHLVVAKLDRLGRWARDVLATVEVLEKLNVTLHIVDFGGDTITTQGHMGKLILTLFAGIAEWERSEIRDRTQKRADHKFDRNELIGTIPYGFDCHYTFADGTVEIRSVAYTVEELAVETTSRGKCLSKILQSNPVEQRWIRDMATWRAQGWSYARIAASLNMAGVRSKRGGQWQCGNVQGILTSRHSQSIINPEEAIAA